MRIDAIAAAGLALVLSAAGCISIQYRPIPFRGTAPDLGLRPEERLPLRLAVVIPDPMGFRYYATFGGGRSASVQADQTENFGGEKNLPISGEMARMAAEAFPQAFQNVTVLRQLPPPGRYDAVVEYSVTTVNQDAAWRSPLSGGGANVFLTMEWKISVMDKSNVEVFSREKSARPARFNVASHTFYDEPLVLALGAQGGGILSAITREAALLTRRELAKTAP